MTGLNDLKWQELRERFDKRIKNGSQSGFKFSVTSNLSVVDMFVCFFNDIKSARTLKSG